MSASSARISPIALENLNPCPEHGLAMSTRLLGPKHQKTLLGLPVRFTKGGDIRGGVFGIYQSKNGKFARVA